MNYLKLFGCVELILSPFINTKNNTHIGYDEFQDMLVVKTYFVLSLCFSTLNMYTGEQNKRYEQTSLK